MQDATPLDHTPPNPSASNGHSQLSVVSRATGPRTPDGKAIVSQNATKFGLFATNPVIRGLESAEEWEEFRLAFVDSCQPVGALELAAANGAATTAWRLRRVPRFEAAAIADHADAAERDAAPREADGVASLRRGAAVAQERLDRLRHLPTLPAGARLSEHDALGIITLAADACGAVDPAELTVPNVPGSVGVFRMDQWTARHVNDMLGYLASLSRSDADDVSYDDGPDLLAGLTEDAEHDLAVAQSRLAEAERELERLRRRRVLPPTKSMDKVIRAEAHLNRTLAMYLHELQAAQDRRLGRPAPIARLDVTGDLPQITKQTP